MLALQRAQGYEEMAFISARLDRRNTAETKGKKPTQRGRGGTSGDEQEGREATQLVRRYQANSQTR